MNLIHLFAFSNNYFSNIPRKSQCPISGQLFFGIGSRAIHELLEGYPVPAGMTLVTKLSKKLTWYRWETSPALILCIKKKRQKKKKEGGGETWTCRCLVTSCSDFSDAKIYCPSAGEDHRDPRHPKALLKKFSQDLKGSFIPLASGSGHQSKVLFSIHRRPNAGVRCG